ncbi:hypothetical protein GF312_07540 [Candidatus Poribacteria bacterium]|nr:hypothetical protein [Candidatus Poribacteria bacterium]
MRKLIFSFTVCLITLFVVSVSMAANLNVLIVLGDSSAVAEADVVESYAEIGGDTFTFERLNVAAGGTRPIEGALVMADEISNGSLDLNDYDIMWLTWNAPGHDGDYFFAGAEEAILSFVEGGGMVYIAAFDDNFTDADGNQIGGWMPIADHPATVSNTGDSELTVTPEGEATGIFDGVDTSGLVLDDNYANTDDAYAILAIRDDNGEPAAVMLPYGNGLYIEVCLDARSTFPAAEPLVGNVLSYMASLAAESPTAVEPEHKLSITWGDIKAY